VLLVRSEHFEPLNIMLLGEGLQPHLGAVERLQVRHFRLPARLTAPGMFVSLDSYPAGRETSYTTKLFTLNKGDVVEMKLEHSLTMSTFEIKRK
jgi:hypothetical protein